MTRSRPAIERFNERVDRNGPQSPHATGRCWLWTGFAGPDGYGFFYLNGRPARAHRAAWELANGPIPDEKFVCHHCDERLCVNVGHLFLSDAQGNMDDAVAKHRTRQWRGALNARWKAHVRNADIEVFYGEGMGCKRIGERLGLHATTIRSRLISLGILRTRSEAARLRAQRLPKAA